MTWITMYTCAFFFSITAIDVWLQCVITAPSTGYPFLIYHRSLKKSVIAALMTLQLNAEMKVRLHFKVTSYLFQGTFKLFRSTTVRR